MHKLLFTLILTLAGSIALAGPILKISDRDVDFGISPQHTAVVKNIIFYSVGDEPVVIDKIDTYCRCITIDYPATPINPGDSQIVAVRLETKNVVGNKLWGQHVFYNNAHKGRFNVKAEIIEKPPNLPVMYIKPFTIAASQFGDKLITEFKFEMINKSDEIIPLSLIYSDETYFILDLPTYVEPGKPAVGRIILTEEGYDREFESTVIIEFLDQHSEQHLYSIPIRRKIFK